MKKLCVLFFVGALLALGQQQEAKPEPKPPEAQAVIQLKYGDANQIASLLDFPGITIHPNSSLHAIAIAGSKESVAALTEEIRKLDVPQKNVELTVYMILASSKTDGEPENPELAPVFKQLRGLFAYKSYRLIDSLMLRGRDGERNGQSQGSVEIPTSSGSARAPYRFRYFALTVNSAGSASSVRIENLDFLLNGTGVNGDINTDIDVGEGQKVVVGKSNFTGGDDAIILVITAKILD